MSKFTKEMVDSYADKLLIGLTEEENKMVLEEFDTIDKTISIIENISGISELEPMMYCLDDIATNLREDVSLPSIPVTDALRNAGKTDGREIEVPKVVE